MFRKDFVWGVAASAYQTEGRDPSDGAGRCIWDTFTDAGKIDRGENAYTACDEIHRYREDFALMRLLGIKNYRFSVSWSRILPEGTGEVNEEGIRLYRDMITEMKKNGIEPYVTLYHWEMPQALQNRGGWLSPESPEWFGQYAAIVAERLSDLVRYFITINEPQCIIMLGHVMGINAPGLKLTREESLLATHHLLMAHGKAVIALREHAKQEIRIGYAPTGGVAYPATSSEEDVEAARKTYFGIDVDSDRWAWNVSWYLDPVVFGTYPAEGLKKFADVLPEIREEDMELIHQPIDFLGQNIYNGYQVCAGENGEVIFPGRTPGYTHTDAQWPVTPAALYWGARFLTEKYHLPLYITENGMACHDSISPDGRVHDPNRIAFLDSYLGALQKASDEGADIRGYFVWTFLDNFEWNLGYSRRFGLVYVDFDSQLRIVKDSAYWYQKVIETNGATLTYNEKARQILFLEQDEDGEVGVTSWITEGAYAGMTLDELLHRAPELFGGVCQPPARTEMITLQIDGEATFLQDQPYLYVTVTEGDGLINGHYIHTGDHFILPSGFGDADLQGQLTLLVSARVPIERESCEA